MSVSREEIERLCNLIESYISAKIPGVHCRVLRVIALDTGSTCVQFKILAGTITYSGVQMARHISQLVQDLDAAVGYPFYLVNWERAKIPDLQITFPANYTGLDNRLTLYQLRK
jgi:hypothetical protein